MKDAQYPTSGAKSGRMSGKCCSVFRVRSIGYSPYINKMDPFSSTKQAMPTYSKFVLVSTIHKTEIHFYFFSHLLLFRVCLLRHNATLYVNSVTGGAVRVSPVSFDHIHNIFWGAQAVGNQAEGRRVPLHVLHWSPEAVRHR